MDNITRAKEPVRLRYKNLTNGNKSLYLDINSDGQRRKEYLRLYIVPPTTPNAKILNAQTLQAANAIRAQRIIDIANGRAGINSTCRSSVRLLDVMQAYQDKQTKPNYINIIGTVINWVIAYSGDNTQLKNVTKQYCIGFIHYLKSTKSKRGRLLSPATQNTIFSVFNSIINTAVRDGLIAANPIHGIDRADKIKVPDSTRQYLTIDEVRTMIDKYPNNTLDTVQRAFLFSCFCGLRYSDIKALKWGDIENDGQQWRARIVMQKTEQANYLPLSTGALRWLPQRNGAADNMNIFYLPSIPVIEERIKKWATNAGITKNITFHTARHTFATSLLTKGADVYTTSKLLGHASVKTTQIYAKIIDQKKTDAVNLLNDIITCQ